MKDKHISLLSSSVLVQAPWVRVRLGDFTFGVYRKYRNKHTVQANNYVYEATTSFYPNYVRRLTIAKINGQVNQYSLELDYPVTPTDDPNFFEKVLSSISNTRKIVFSYGDAATPLATYKEEEAIITDVQQSFNFGSGGDHNSVISYSIKAVSSASLAKTGNFSFINAGKKKPSDEIKSIFKNPVYGLRELFTGMSDKNLDTLIDGSDAYVELDSKVNISPLDYITYLVSCMEPDGSANGNKQLNTGIYLLAIYDSAQNNVWGIDTLNTNISGTYFTVRRVDQAVDHTDAYTIDIGVNTGAIVTSFNVANNDSYSIYFNYSEALHPTQYVSRINNNGLWEDVYAPSFTSKNDSYQPKAADKSWYTKVTKFPISASVTIQGLLRPALLMSYVRLNVIFPGGNKHISSGLYIITKQQDSIDASGYRTTLNLIRISGDNL